MAQDKRHGALRHAAAANDEKLATELYFRLRDLGLHFRVFE